MPRTYPGGRADSPKPNATAEGANADPGL
jgi:hypothetical protein